jgi:hypothetical protein
MSLYTKFLTGSGLLKVLAARFYSFPPLGEGWDGGLCALAILSNKAGAFAVVFRPALHRQSPDERMLASPAPIPTFPQRGKEPSQ